MNHKYKIGNIVRCLTDFPSEGIMAGDDLYIIDEIFDDDYPYGISPVMGSGDGWWCTESEIAIADDEEAIKWRIMNGK